MAMQLSFDFSALIAELAVRSFDGDLDGVLNSMSLGDMEFENDLHNQSEFMDWLCSTMICDAISVASHHKSSLESRIESLSWLISDATGVRTFEWCVRRMGFNPKDVRTSILSKPGIRLAMAAIKEHFRKEVLR